MITGIPVTGPPPAPSIAINVSSVTPVNYQASAVTRDGAAWLSITPSTGSTSSSSPAQLQVSTNSSGLQNGVYTGDITISTGAATRVVRVTMYVQPLTLNPVARGAIASCAPAQLVLTENSFADGSSVPAGEPAPLSVRVTDNCGTPITGASVVASFDNGDAPLPLLDDGTGAYSGTWVAARVSPSVTVTLAATSPSVPPPSPAGQPAVSVVRLGTVSGNPAPPPVQARGGTAKNSLFGPFLGAPLAPGAIASIYGSGLSSTSGGTTPVTARPTQFGGTQVLIGGIAAPLFYVSANQVDLQIPLELAPNQKYSVLAFSSNLPAIPETITLGAAAPGLLTLPDGSVLAQRQDGSFVSSTAPAKPGEALVIYLVGMGSVNPTLPSGQAAPSSPLSVVNLAPVMTLDGATITPFFAGLTPRYVGLYQINFLVPSGVRTGQLKLTVAQGNLSANPTTLPVSSN
jgi:uncharacterized protein (TIGR03437 family)